MFSNEATDALSRGSIEKVGIYKNFDKKFIRATSLNEDINEYLCYLKQANGFEQEQQSFLKNSSDSVIKHQIFKNNTNNLHSFLLDIFKKNVFANDTEVFEYLVSQLKLSSSMTKNNVCNNKNFITLSPASDLTDDLKMDLLSSYAKNQVPTSENNDNIIPNYLNDFNINIDTFFGEKNQETNCLKETLRPKSKGKLIDSPETEKSGNSLTESLNSEKEFKEQKELQEELCQIDHHSMWLIKLDLWVHRFKEKKKNQRMKFEKNKKMEERELINKRVEITNTESKSSLAEIIDTNNNNSLDIINKEMLERLLVLNNYSKFYVPNNNKTLRDSVMLNNRPYNSRILILNETDFDRTLINLHHKHFLFMNILSPVECSACLDFIREHKLQNDLKKSSYFKQYLNNCHQLESLINSPVYDRYNKPKNGSSFNNFWSGIKREISFKLRRNDSKSIKTIGSLSDKLKQNSEKNNFLPVSKHYLKSEKNYNAKKHSIVQQYYKPDTKDKFTLSKEIINYYKQFNFELIQNNFCSYPIYKSSNNQLKNSYLIMPLIDETFYELFLSWNSWYWKYYNNKKFINDNILLQNSSEIKCNKCETKISDAMENFLFRYDFNYYKDRLCIECKNNSNKMAISIYENSSEDNLDTKETLIDSNNNEVSVNEQEAFFNEYEDDA
ncbi:hypothetical protein ACO0SA_001671 [Hanseniaspora valbyensis]